MNFNLLRDLKKTQATKKANAATAYLDLCRTVAKGIEVKPVSVQPILDTADKTVEAFEADVITMQKRIERRRRIEEIAKYAKERTSIEEKIVKADADFEAAEKLYDDLVDPLQFKLDRIKAEADESRNLESELASTCIDPALLAEKASINREQKEIHPQRDKLSTDVRKWKQGLQSSKDSAEHAKAHGTDSRAEEHRSKAKELENLLARDEPKLKELNTQLAELETREQDLRKRLLRP